MAYTKYILYYEVKKNLAKIVPVDMINMRYGDPCCRPKIMTKYILKMRQNKKWFWGRAGHKQVRFPNPLALGKASILTKLRYSYRE